MHQRRMMAVGSVGGLLEPFVRSSGGTFSGTSSTVTGAVVGDLVLMFAANQSSSFGLSSAITAPGAGETTEFAYNSNGASRFICCSREAPSESFSTGTFTGANTVSWVVFGNASEVGLIDGDGNLGGSPDNMIWQALGALAEGAKLFGWRRTHTLGQPDVPSPLVALDGWPQDNAGTNREHHMGLSPLGETSFAGVAQTVPNFCMWATCIAEIRGGFGAAPPAETAIYVAADGNDGNAGTEVAPLLTLAAALAETPDTIYLNRGDTWRESMTAISNLTVDAYGTGDLPVISGANVVTGLETDGTAGTEGAGELGDADFDAGNTSELVVTVNIDSTPTASTTVARSGTHSMRITSNGTDGRTMGAIAASSDHGTGTRSYFFAVYVAQAGVKTSSKLRMFQLRDGTTARIYMEMNWDASRNVTTWTLNNLFGGDMLITPSVVGWNWDAWNTIEVRLTTGASGEIALYLNGALQGTDTADYSSTNLTGIDRMYVGNDAFGAGLSSGEFAYFDDLKISADPISAELNATGDPNLWDGAFSVAEPRQVFVNGQRGQRVATAGAVDAHRKWHWASDVLTVYGTGSAEPTVEASVRNDLVTLNGTTGVTLANLHLDKAGRRAVEADTATAFIVEDCEITDPYVVGINSSGNTAGQRENVRIRRNEISGAGQGGIGFGGRLDDWIIEDNTVSGCGWASKDHEVLPTGANEWQFEWTHSIKNWGWGGPGWQGEVIVRRNTVSGSLAASWVTHENTNGQGIWWDEVLEPTARHLIHDNIVHDCTSRGLYSEKCDDVDIYNNLVYRCAAAQYTAAIEAQSNQYGYDVILDEPDNEAPRQVSSTRIWNNTAVGGWWSLSVLAENTGTSISDTVVRDNIFVGEDGAAGVLYIVGGGANNTTNGTGNIYNNNCFGPDTGGGRVWGATNHGSVTAFQSGSSGAVTNSVLGNPLFVDAENDDYSLDTGSPCLDAATDSGDVGYRAP